MESKKITLSNHVRSKYYKFLPVLGAIFILISLVLTVNAEESNPSNYVSGLYGVMMLLQYYLKPKYYYFEFTSEGILKPQEIWCFEKRKLLKYDAIVEAFFVVGDFIFRNKDIEIRIPKELIGVQESTYLQHLLVELQQENSIKKVALV